MRRLYTAGGRGNTRGHRTLLALIQARLGRRGPSPATSSGSPLLVVALAPAPPTQTGSTRSRLRWTWRRHAARRDGHGGADGAALAARRPRCAPRRGHAARLGDLFIAIGSPRAAATAEKVSPHAHDRLERDRREAHVDAGALAADVAAAWPDVARAVPDGHAAGAHGHHARPRPPRLRRAVRRIRTG